MQSARVNIRVVMLQSVMSDSASVENAATLCSSMMSDVYAALHSHNCANLSASGRLPATSQPPNLAAHVIVTECDVR